MKSLQFAGAMGLALLLAGCATMSSEPVSAPSGYHLTNVTAQAAPGVEMSQTDIDRVLQKVKEQLNATTPGIMVAPSSPDAANALALKLTFTRYESGSAAARFLLMGLGQIHIDADLTLMDANGRPAGQYQISKQYALGGIAGATTSMEDVEIGFAKSVAAVVR